MWRDSWDEATSLDLVDLRDPDRARVASVFTISDSVSSMAASGSRFYTRPEAGTLLVLDAIDPFAPSPVAEIALDGVSYLDAMAFAGAGAYLVEGGDWTGPRGAVEEEMTDDSPTAPRSGVVYGTGLCTGIALSLLVFLVFLAASVVPSFARFFGAMGVEPGPLTGFVMTAGWRWGVPAGLVAVGVVCNLGPRTCWRLWTLAAADLLALGCAALTLVACYQPLFETI